MFQKIGAIIDDLFALGGDRFQEKSDAESGAELIAKLWTDSPEDWLENNPHMDRYRHKTLAIELRASPVLDICLDCTFDGRGIAIPKKIGAAMFRTRKDYEAGIRNEKMNQTARDLAAAILRVERP